jgi:MSHA pilin protein MshC
MTIPIARSKKSWPVPIIFSRGFTLVELIVTMVIIGIMAIAVVPRFDIITGFDAVGYADQLKSVLRYGQKSALAHRRAIIVDFSGDTPTLAYTAESSCVLTPPNMTYPTALRPRGNSTSLPVAKIGTTDTDEWICFNTMGKPFVKDLTALSATLTISITDASAISIEPETGYVH